MRPHTAKAIVERYSSDILKLWKIGHSAEAIAKSLGISPSSALAAVRLGRMAGDPRALFGHDRRAAMRKLVLSQIGAREPAPEPARETYVVSRSLGIVPETWIVPDRSCRGQTMPSPVPVSLARINAFREPGSPRFGAPGSRPLNRGNEVSA